MLHNERSLTMLQELPKGTAVKRYTAAENAEHMIRCLISYHERTHAGTLSEPDNYLSALRYAYSLVTRELEEEREWEVEHQLRSNIAE
jgi:hypothetical protein